MPFVLDCFGAFQTRATFYAIFEKFLLVPPFYFLRKCWFWVTLPKCAITWLFGHFWSRCFRQNLLQAWRYKCILNRVECNLRQSAFAPFKRGLVFGRFLKNFPWCPLCTFSENAGFGWPCKNCCNLAIRALLEPLFAPKFFLVFAL